jgi:hypothetical protein
MRNQLLADTVAALSHHPICVRVQIAESREFSRTQFVIRLKASLANGRDLHIRYYVNGDHVDYSYQLLARERILCRWDNKEHFPAIVTHPHHFHQPDGAVSQSALRGQCLHDLGRVLLHIAAMLDGVDAKR